MCDCLKDCSVVGDQYAVKAHLLTEDLSHELLVNCGRDVVDSVEACHNHTGSGFDSGFIGGQVILAERML